MMENERKQKNIMESEEHCIDLLMEGVMALDGILYTSLEGMTFHDLWRVYCYADAEKLELLRSSGLPTKEAVAKSLVGSRGWDQVLAHKVEAMNDDEAEELAERIRVLDEVRGVLQDELVTL